jgi:hypothetical protein
LQAAFRIRDVLIWFQILGSVHWITDPDPALFSGGFLRVITKICYCFKPFCAYYLYCMYICMRRQRLQVIKKSVKLKKSRFFSVLLLIDRRIWFRIRIRKHNYGPGSVRPKNIRLRIRNTALVASMRGSVRTETNNRLFALRNLEQRD